MHLPKKLLIFLVGQCFLSVAGLSAPAETRFYLHIDPQNQLIVFGDKGEKVAGIALSSISQQVTVADTQFEISYGRDADNLLTAVLSPSSSHPKDLHFTVLDKKVDSDSKAVITLTFSRTGRQVEINPGIDGLVQVNSSQLKNRDSINENPGFSIPDVPEISSTRLATQEVTAKAEPSLQISVPVSITSTHVSPPTECDIMPISESPSYSEREPSRARVVFYWSEPVSTPEGILPPVARNEMKFLEVQGAVSVSASDGSLEKVENGMALASDATIITHDHASVAILMGGVDSVRLLPNTEAKISQRLDGSIRNISIVLNEGTVFSRVGHQANEIENYRVITPQGTATANGTEFADTIKNHRHHLFVARGKVDFTNGRQHMLVSASSESLGHGAMPFENLPETEINQALFDTLPKLQPFNQKLPLVIDHMNQETATQAEIAYYKNIQRVIFDPLNYTYDKELIPLVRRVAAQDLEPFGTRPLTPF